MKEIGGYFELEKNYGSMLHDNALALSCGRAALEYLIVAKKIKKICLPFFLCDVVRHACEKHNVKIRYYTINELFLPSTVSLDDDEWLYLVNYYGLIPEKEIQSIHSVVPKLIVDNAHSYYSAPLPQIDTIYTCRKFFGVPDGAFLYTDTIEDIHLERMISYERMVFVLGRFEKTATEFYVESQHNNSFFDNIPIQKMSLLTENLLRGIDYETVKQKRFKNNMVLQNELEQYNLLTLNSQNVPFCYPLMLDNAEELRKKLIDEKIYVPVLWPNVLNEVEKNSIEYMYTETILPLPCDQRYDENDMERIAKIVRDWMVKRK